MNYDCRPVRQNYGAQLLCVALFACAGVSFVLGGVMEHAILYQVLGLCFVLPAIQLIARYMASRYLYRLHVQEDGTAQLEIFVWRGGARMQMAFCVGMAQITAITPLGKKNARPPKGCRRHNFAQDLRPQRATVLSLSVQEGACEVLLCPDEGLLRLLHEYTASPSQN
ncbi:MAG: hypothetical protein J6U87_02715 [Clostridia bacterium]|nr:hypothetical protein [Clostridia bacterium]